MKKAKLRFVRFDEKKHSPDRRVDWDPFLYEFENYKVLKKHLTKFKKHKIKKDKRSNKQKLIDWLEDRIKMSKWERSWYRKHPENLTRISMEDIKRDIKTLEKTLKEVKKKS
jgi:hypothetical protein